MATFLALILGASIGSALAFAWVALLEREEPAQKRREFIDPNGEG